MLWFGRQGLSLSFHSSQSHNRHSLPVWSVIVLHCPRSNCYTYPAISIAANTVLRPNCISNRKSTVFLQTHVPFWKQVLFSVKSHGVLRAVQMVADHEYEKTSNAGFVLQRIAMVILFLHNYLLALYSHYFPYDLLTPDEQVQALSRNRDWANGIVRAFKWHPTAGNVLSH